MTLKQSENIISTENQDAPKKWLETNHMVDLERRIQQLSTSQELQTLMNSLNSSEKKESQTELRIALDKLEQLDNVDDNENALNEVYSALSEVKDKTTEAIKSEVDKVKESVWYNGQSNYLSYKLFSKALVARAENPQSIIDNMYWLMIGVTDTIGIVKDVAKSLAVDLVRLPIDIFRR